eukprot:CAMPEP_0181325232 /NCGR_PEP_ID=MMETSP1101-20121128/20808_1 /TAXON_ID=46948 /ORGANISM="Rhodomonas abbreviata, Strain Caron Lab Isolate" /LENGTH=104 /DNA_ID=CAMNT_0023433511 /DNA_START=175 /DNA_END=489 /DNA_ORIENTATION=+
MMCLPNNQDVPEIRKSNSNKSPISEPASTSGISRRESIMSFLKGGAAIVVGEAVVSEVVEVGAIRSAPIIAEEVGAAAAGAEGAAMLRNGQEVLQFMEKTMFGI